MKNISLEFGKEVRKAGMKMKAEGLAAANTYGFIDLFVKYDSYKGINLKNSLAHIKNRLHYFSPDFYERLQKWLADNGKYSIDEVQFTIGALKS